MSDEHSESYKAAAARLAKRGDFFAYPATRRVAYTNFSRPSESHEEWMLGIVVSVSRGGQVTGFRRPGFNYKERTVPGTRLMIARAKVRADELENAFAARDSMGFDSKAELVTFVKGFLK